MIWINPAGAWVWWQGAGDDGKEIGGVSKTVQGPTMAVFVVVLVAHTTTFEE